MGTFITIVACVLCVVFVFPFVMAWLGVCIHSLAPIAVVAVLGFTFVAWGSSQHNNAEASAVHTADTPNTAGVEVSDVDTTTDDDPATKYEECAKNLASLLRRSELVVEQLRATETREADAWAALAEAQAEIELLKTRRCEGSASSKGPGHESSL